MVNSIHPCQIQKIHYCLIERHCKSQFAILFYFSILCMIIGLLHIVNFTAEQKETIILVPGTTAAQGDI